MYMNLHCILISIFTFLYEALPRVHFTRYFSCFILLELMLTFAVLLVLQANFLYSFEHVYVKLVVF